MRLLFTLLLAFPMAANAVVIVTDQVLMPTCSSNNGSITLYAAGGTPPYTFMWSDGPTTQNRTGLAPGTYTVTVTDANSATDQATYTITAQPDLGYIDFSYILNGTHHFPCPGQSNGIAVVPLYPNAMNNWTGVNGVPPYFVNLSLDISPVPQGGTDNNGNPWFGNIPANAPVNISVTDAAGCIGGSNSWSFGPAPGALWVASVTPACAGGNNGSISFGSSFDFQSYAGMAHLLNAQMQQVWQSPEPGVAADATGLAPGTYTLELSYGPPPAYVCSGIPVTTVVVDDLGPACGEVNGVLYIDEDQDCVQDPLEAGVPFRVLEITPGPEFAITDANGAFTRSLINGNFNLNPTGSDLLPICPATLPSPFTINGNIVSLPLALGTTTPLDLEVQCWAGAARPGFAHSVSVHVSNLAPLTSGPLTTTLTFDANMTFMSATPAPTSVVGNTITWNTAALPPYQSFAAQVYLQVPADIGLLGQAYTHTATCSQPVSEGDLSNNTDAFNGVFTASYDPNDKTAYTSTGSSAEQFFIGIDSHIDYLIRFQNTGNDTAFTVVVTDTLDQDLDLATYVQGAASHPFSVAFKPGRVVEWRFDNILLPDSTTNEAESHGFVTFRIRPREPLLAGTELRNNADIFFDFNPPVRTNDAVLTVDFSTGLSHATSHELMLFPDPAQHAITLRVPDGAVQGELWITAADGRTVLKQRATTTVDVEQFSAGVYHVLVRDGATVHRARFVKQ